MNLRSRPKTIAVSAAFTVVVMTVALYMWHDALGNSNKTDPGKHHVLLRSVDSVFNGGTIKPGDSIIHEFVIRNAGDATAHLSDPMPSCGCTSAVLGKRTLDPGDSTLVRVRFNSLGKGTGTFEKSVKVATKETPYVITSLVMQCSVRLPENQHAGTMMTVSGIFEGNCTRCHVDFGRGFNGRILYQADCGICHSSEHSNAPRILPTDSTHLDHIIRFGKPGTSMPAFDQSRGGPLTPEQIESLIKYLKQKGGRV
jgi:hypothetical protein